MISKQPVLMARSEAGFLPRSGPRSVRVLLRRFGSRRLRRALLGLRPSPRSISRAVCRAAHKALGPAAWSTPVDIQKPLYAGRKKEACQNHPNACIHQDAPSFLQALRRVAEPFSCCSSCRATPAANRRWQTKPLAASNARRLGDKALKRHQLAAPTLSERAPRLITKRIHPAFMRREHGSP